MGIKIWSPYLIDNVRWSYFDVLHQQKEKVIVDDILLVNIDEKAIEKYGQYPFPRDIYADTLWETHHSNTHVFNILFAEEDRFGGDEVFAEALENRLTILSSAPTIEKESGNAPRPCMELFRFSKSPNRITKLSLGYGRDSCHTTCGEYTKF